MKVPQRLACSLLIAALAACHQGDDQPSVHGVAAIGAPISGGSVALRCADGSSYSTTTASNGTWGVDVLPSSMPCAERVSGGTVNGVNNGNTLYSMASGPLPATSNITPMTDLAMAYAVDSGAAQALADWYNSDPAGSIELVREQLAAANSQLRTQLAAAGYTLPTADFDPFTAALIAGALNDLYDLMLDAIAQALADAGQNYSDAREAIVNGDPLPDAPEGSGPVDPTDPTSTPLPADKLGASFDDLDAAHLWISNTGGITVLSASGDGTVGVSMRDKDHDGNRVNIFPMPNKTGTYHCGDAVSSGGTVQMLITFDDISNVQKNYTSSDSNNVTLPGYSCTVTITHVGTIDSGNLHYDDDVIEGTFSGKLRQRVRPCTGEGENANCAAYKELTVSNGKFRINKLGTYTPPASGQDGTLAARIGKAFAGTFTLSCDEGQGTTSTHTIVINNDGSSTLDGGAVSDATHTGEIDLSGHNVNAAHREPAVNWPSFLLQFDSSGAIVKIAPVNIVHTSFTTIKFCKGVSGSVNPTAFNASGEIGSHARSQTLSCPQPTKPLTNPANAPLSPVGPTTFTVSADGSMTLGNLTVSASDYLANATYSAGDYVSFHDPEDIYILGGGNSAGDIKLDFTLDASTNTVSVHYQNTYESGICKMPPSS